MPEHRILLGVIGRPHGVRGLVRVTSHTADPADLTAYGMLSDDKGRRFVLRWRGNGVAEVEQHVGATVAKIADRTAAEALTNTRLYIDRAQLPVPEPEEFYLADLIGLTAVDAEGGTLGKVVTVHDYGAGASLEIVRDGAPQVLVPFTRACVPELDPPNGRLVVHLAHEVGLSREADQREARSGEGEGRNARTARASRPSPSPLRVSTSPAAGGRGVLP